jgi:hypothetical protein
MCQGTNPGIHQLAVISQVGTKKGPDDFHRPGLLLHG